MVDVNLTPEQLEKQLKDKKWEDAQVKGLAAWANTYLKPRECVIHKLPDDVKSGVCLLNLLDALGQPLNQSVGKYVSKPKHRIEMAQNCNQALNFAQQQLGVRLVGVGAEDILDGNLKLVLGMLWSTFRKLGLGSLSQGGDKAGNPEDDLLRWYQQMCQPYGVKVDNFKSSFNDGLAWAALIDQFDPDYLPFEKLNKNDPASVLTQVFDVAEKKLGIPKLLDVEDLLKGEADERSITLYSSLFYHAWTTNQEQIKLANANRALRKGASDVSSDLAAINAAIAALQAEHDRLAPLAAAWKAQLGELDDRIAALLAEIARLQAEKARLEAEIKRLQDERAARAKADLAKLRQEEASLQGSNDEADRLRRGREAAQLLADRDELLERLRKGVGATGGEGGQARDASLLGHGALSLRAALDGLAQELRAHVNALHAEWRTLEAEDGGAATAEARRAFEKEMRDREAEVRKLKGKSEEQAKACARAAEGTTRTLLSVLSVKDAVNEMGKWVDRKGYMMAHEDGRRWKKRWFVLRGFDLLYYEKREDQDAEEDSGRLSLEDSTVQSRDSDEAKLQWVIHIATTVVAADGQRKKEVLQVAAKTQEDRDDWFAALHSRALYTHYLALAARHAERPDPRFVAMFEKRLLSLVQLDNLPLLAHHVKVVEKFIEAHPETVRFSFSRASLADDALSSLAAALKSRPQTASLVFAGNAITQGGAVALSDAIAAWGASPALTELNVSGNRIPAAGVVALLAAVKGCKEMHTLDVSGNLLDDKAVGAYVAAVKGMRNITEVQLRKVGLKDKALAEVSEVLKGAECAIVSVDVSGNEVGDEGVARLCEALKANKSVRRVNLGGNAVTAKGVAAVHEMLKVNETVEEVDLSGMRSIVGGKELTALAEMKGVMFTGFLPMRM